MHKEQQKEKARQCAGTLFLLAKGIVVFEMVYVVWWIAVAFSCLRLPVHGAEVAEHIIVNYRLLLHTLGVMAFFFLYAGKGGPFGWPSIFGMMLLLVVDVYTMADTWVFLHESPQQLAFWGQFSLACFGVFLAVVQVAWVFAEYFHQRATGIRFDGLKDEPSANVLGVIDVKLH